MLPEVRASSEVYGEVKGGKMAGVKIAGDLGDQQAATFGQTCFDVSEGQEHVRDERAPFCSTRARRRSSPGGLLTTVCYKIGDADVRARARSRSPARSCMAATT